MAYTAVTNTFTSGVTASAADVNRNFTDLVNGLSDGTKDIYVNNGSFAGGASFAGSVSVVNNATVNGNIIASGSMNITGGTVLQSTLKNTGPSTFSGTVNIVGAAYNESTLRVTDNATFSAAVAVASTLRTTGNATFSAAVAIGSTLNTVGTATFSGNVTVGANLIVASSITLTGGTATIANLDVSNFGYCGASMTAGYAQLSSAKCLGSFSANSLVVSAGASFLSNVQIVGTTSFTGNTTHGGEAIYNDKASYTGNATFGNVSTAMTLPYVYSKNQGMATISFEAVSASTITNSAYVTINMPSTMVSRRDFVTPVAVLVNGTYETAHLAGAASLTTWYLYRGSGIGTWVTGVSLVFGLPASLMGPTVSILT